MSPLEGLFIGLIIYFVSTLILFIKYIGLCQHEYHLVGEHKILDDNNKFVDMATIYCPKCRKRKSVTKDEWKILENIQYAEIAYLKSKSN